ncbi:MAG TPA: glycosyltransferase [Bacteroidia bacterium]|nr:glycosyltransferase [Bacteroidia bacterium]
MSSPNPTKVLILCAHRRGRSPSQRYRFEQYLDHLNNFGFEFEFSPLLNAEDDVLFYATGGFLRKVWILLKTVWIRVMDIRRFASFHIIFIQREAHFLGTSFFEKRAFRSGAHVIFDFDDSIWLADTSPGNLKWQWVKRPSKFFSNLRYAHTVLAGNAYLYEKALPYNTSCRIVPTTINTQWHIPKHELRHGDRICIGWSGSLSTVKHFELLLPVLKKLRALHGHTICIRVISDKPYTCQGLDIDSQIWSEDKEVNMLNSFDIGIMPLEDNAWSKGKCGLKALSYMACEVPVVLSPVGVNSTLIEHGHTGFLAETEEEWMHYLDLLIQDKSQRLKLGKAGRAFVEKNYSVERYKAVYLEVFKHAQSAR